MLKSKVITLALQACILGTLFFSVSFAQEVFKWQDENGVVHYSTRPGKEGAKPTKLPKITKADVKISQELTTCDKHGGINCGLGPDHDGSVICYDGYRGAVTRYKFECSAAKLQITDISENPRINGISVFVRNSKSVEALNVKVVFKSMDGSEIALSGPSQIEPFGMGEYILQVNASTAPLLDKPSRSNLKLSCTNCS